MKLAGSSSMDDQIITIAPLDSELGDPATASQSAVAGLRNGLKINGVVLIVTSTHVKIFRPPAARGAQKNWDDVFCDSAAVVRYQAAAYALLCLFGDGSARIYSIPALKQIAGTGVGHILDVRRFAEAIITPTGDIFGWTGPSEVAMLNVWGTGSDLQVFLSNSVPTHLDADFSSAHDLWTSFSTWRPSSHPDLPSRTCSG